MSRFRDPKHVFLTILAGLLPLGANAAPNSSPTYGGQVDFGAQLLHLQDGCASIHGALTAGSFFDDLKRIDKGGQLVFRKSGTIVTEYPESITTSIRIAGDSCAAQSSVSPSAIFHGDSYLLKLEVFWKHDMEMRPAAFSSGTAHCVGYSSIVGPGENGKVPSISCQLTVDSRGVPLGDHLVVRILGSDGRLVTRISAAP